MEKKTNLERCDEIAIKQFPDFRNFKIKNSTDKNKNNFSRNAKEHVDYLQPDVN